VPNDPRRLPSIICSGPGAATGAWSFGAVAHARVTLVTRAVDILGKAA